MTQSEPTQPRGFTRRHLLFLIPIIAIAALGWYLLQPRKEVKPKKTVLVSVAKVAQQNVPILLRSIGTVTAVNSVAVKPHVNGQIMQTHFKEGQRINTGELLFTIDPRPLQAAMQQQEADVQSKTALVAQAQAAISKDEAMLTQARANIEKDKAIAANADVEANRYASLSKEGAVSQEQADQYRTTFTSSKATVRADQASATNVKATIAADKANLMSARAQLSSSQALLENAKVQLSYTSVKSPISGVAGNIQILTGNVVRADTDVLVTINQIQPININLSVPENKFNDVRKYAAQSQVVAEVFDSNGNAIANGGKLIFQNNTVDATTGTVLLKVAFDNAQAKLWPGQFVNTVLTLSMIPNAIVVPSQAVQNGLNGTFVWMLSPDKTVFMQPVKQGETVGDLTVITSGLSPGQIVVTDGQLQLQPKSKVQISKGPAL